MVQHAMDVQRSLVMSMLAKGNKHLFLQLTG